MSILSKPRVFCNCTFFIFPRLAFSISIGLLFEQQTWRLDIIAQRLEIYYKRVYYAWWPYEIDTDWYTFSPLLDWTNILYSLCTVFLLQMDHEPCRLLYLPSCNNLQRLSFRKYRQSVAPVILSKCPGRERCRHCGTEKFSSQINVLVCGIGSYTEVFSKSCWTSAFDCAVHCSSFLQRSKLS